MNKTTELRIAQEMGTSAQQIVDWIDWGGHWVIATGYEVVHKTDIKKDTLFFADSAAYDTNVLAVPKKVAS